MTTQPEIDIFTSRFERKNETTMDSSNYVLIMAKPGSLRRGLQALISSLSGIGEVGLADNHSAALQMTHELQPALTLLESDTSGDQIWETLREIKRLSPQTKCIVLIDNVEKEQNAHLSSADAVILQGTSPDELVMTLEFLLTEANPGKPAQSDKFTEKNRQQEKENNPMTEISSPTLLTTVPKQNKVSKIIKWTGITLGGLILLIVAYIAFMLIKMNYVPTSLDYSTSLLSDQGSFSIAYKPEVDQILVNQMHSWILHVETPDGKPVVDAQITVDGDMPQHGHGLPTKPQVTQHLGNGDYKVEGMKFHMSGWWIVEFKITAGDQSDQVTFNLQLQ